jgi:hypothetical protein
MSFVRSPIYSIGEGSLPQLMKKPKSHLPGFIRLALFCCLLGSAAPAEAQQEASKPAQDSAAKPVQVARISGADISVANGPSAAAASLPVTSGNVVTVHSGQAHLNLESGGELGVCGPAKFQLLQSGNAMTIALQFGRIHVRLSGSFPLVIYTPFFQATPSALPEGQRDATVGLEPNGAFCARAEQGGLQIQQQLTGESLIVPQPQEVFFAGGDTKPVRNLSGCTCALKSSASVPPPAVPPETASPNTPPAPRQTPAPPRPNTGEVAAPGNKPVSTAEAGSESTPPSPQVSAQTQATWAAPPAVAPPEVRVVMPALSFNADSPKSPLNPTPGEILLVREVRVLPEYVFTGRVAAARSQSDSKPLSSPPVVQPQGEKPGFWTRLKRLFGS